MVQNAIAWEWPTPGVHPANLVGFGLLDVPALQFTRGVVFSSARNPSGAPHNLKTHCSTQPANPGLNIDAAL
jgi:hypothetical protein